MRAQLSKRAHEHALRTIVPYRRLDLRDSRVRKFRTREKYLKNTEKIVYIHEARGGWDGAG